MNENLLEFHDEAQFLWLQRCYAVKAPNYSPAQFADLDEQLAAQLDGLRNEAESAWTVCLPSLDAGGAEEFFVASVLAIDTPSWWSTVLERSVQLPEVFSGVASALGWIGTSRLADVTGHLLGTTNGRIQALGIAACAMHRQDPGPILKTWLSAASGVARLRALRAAGELGRMDLLPDLHAALADPQPETRYWAAWSAALLGDRGAACHALRQLALKPGRRQQHALQAFILASDWQQGHELLAELEGLPGASRLRIIGAGYSGNARYAPWLLEQMDRPETARIAGESFVLITGVDYNAEQLETMPPEGHEDGPSDDPEDENVDLPEDVALPWLDVERTKAWWAEHRSRFAPDHRSFLGASPDEQHCRHVLRTGSQRQRWHAAQLWCLSAPGSPLFPTSAPAWRQQRLMQAWPA